MIAPTRNPSTAGARWIFYAREYLRRVGRTPQTEARFEALKRTLESECDEQLKLKLKNLQITKLKLSTQGREYALTTADILVVEAELGYRKSIAQAERGPRESNVAYENVIIDRALTVLMEDLGTEYIREKLILTARRVASTHFKTDTDIHELVDRIIEYKRPKR